MIHYVDYTHSSMILELSSVSVKITLTLLHCFTIYFLGVIGICFWSRYLGCNRDHYTYTLEITPALVNGFPSRSVLITLALALFIVSEVPM